MNGCGCLHPVACGGLHAGERGADPSLGRISGFGRQALQRYQNVAIRGVRSRGGESSCRGI